MNATGRDDGCVWISIVASTATVASGCSQEGTWERCCYVPPYADQWRMTSSGGLECHCPPEAVCNYLLTCASDASVHRDSGTDASVLDAGFPEVGPMDDADSGALVDAWDGSAMDDDAFDATRTEDAGSVDAPGNAEDAGEMK